MNVRGWKDVGFFGRFFGAFGGGKWLSCSGLVEHIVFFDKLFGCFVFLLYLCRPK